MSFVEAPGGTRTPDPRITNALRYQLRYGSSSDFGLVTKTFDSITAKMEKINPSAKKFQANFEQLPAEVLILPNRPRSACFHIKKEP